MGKIVNGLLWKFLERSGISIIHFTVQIVLARLLAPELYGVLSVMMVAINIAIIFIESGLFCALVQNKDVTEEDYSSVLWLSILIATLMYGLIFLGAPLISDLYQIPDIVQPLRILALMLFPGALNLVCKAKATREMDFKKVCYGSTAGALVSGGVALVIALLGGGLWTLVVKSLLDVLVSCIVLRFVVPIRLHFSINFKRLRVLFSYSWKILASSIWFTLYRKLSTLIIGKKYNMTALAYYERGNQFPDLIINTVNLSMTSVLFPAMSAEQDEPQKVKMLMQNSIAVGSYLISPMMLGLAAVAETLVRLILTEKWLPCVPFLQMCCLAAVLYPAMNCNLEAINAMGRPDICLKLDIINTFIDIPFFLIAVFCFETPLAIAAYGIISSVMFFMVNSHPNKKLINYSGWQQLRDVCPTIAMSAMMFICVVFVGIMAENAEQSDFMTLCIQTVVGVLTYAVLSVVLKPKPYRMALGMLKELRDKNKEES